MAVRERLRQPITTVSSYSPCDKVDVQLNQGLWRLFINEDDLVREILALCSRLEVLCINELKVIQVSLQQYSIPKRCFTVSFDAKANSILHKIKGHFEYLSDSKDGTSLPVYLRTMGVDMLFPRALQFIDNPDKLFTADANQKSPMIEYFELLANLNHIMAISNTLNSKIDEGPFHKYIAHQLALLYRAVDHLGSRKQQYKQMILERFEEIKETCRNIDRTSQSTITPEMKEWILKLTASLGDTIRSLPHDITEQMQPFINFYLKYNAY